MAGDEKKNTESTQGSQEVYTQNRELSWLRFNERVLLEGCDADTPLLERLNFVSIFDNNLTEFFMIRVGSLTDLNLLKNPPIDNKTGMNPAQQLDAIFDACPRLYKLRDKVFNEIEEELEKEGISRLRFKNLEGSKLKYVQNYAKSYILPILSPQIIDPHHPFPHFENGLCYVVVQLKPLKGSKKKKQAQSLVGILPLPQSVPRILFLPDEESVEYLLCEDILCAYAADIFDMYHVVSVSTGRVTRNADLNLDAETFDDDLNYRAHMKKILKKRTRLAPVRLEASNSLPKPILEFACDNLHIKPKQVFVSESPLDMSYVATLMDHVKSMQRRSLYYPPFSPQNSPQIDPFSPICVQVENKDILLSYPYQSMDPVLQLLRESAADPNVLSIKITLYRVARQSRLIEYLTAAAENGKEVVVLLELRARFDEENNIEWAEHLEEAGCRVIYGFEHYKVHTKICLITRNDDGRIRRITQLGTGNYHEKTVKLYTDFSLITSDPIIGEDANTFFRNMSLGKLEGEYSCLKVAPAGLRDAIFAGIDNEISKAKAGQDGYILFKMNSLTDKRVIDKLVEASRAGVKIQLIVRGICCLVPGIEGATENISVISIVGRFLEHARIYTFGKGQSALVYLSSADMMTRNNERRVEIAFPIIDVDLRERVLHYLDIQLSDTVKARRLKRNGRYGMIKTLPNQTPLNCQNYAMAEAISLATAIEQHASFLDKINDGIMDRKDDKIVLAPQQTWWQRFKSFFSRKSRKASSSSAVEYDEGLSELAKNAAKDSDAPATDTKAAAAAPSAETKTDAPVASVEAQADTPASSAQAKLDASAQRTELLPQLSPESDQAKLEAPVASVQANLDASAQATELLPKLSAQSTAENSGAQSLGLKAETVIQDAQDQTAVLPKIKDSVTEKELGIEPQTEFTKPFLTGEIPQQGVVKLKDATSTQTNPSPDTEIKE